jgi:NADPH-dependent ferric siderophore reductase
MLNDTSSNLADLNVRRVRHSLKFRLTEVTRVSRVTPHLVRVTLAGEDLRDFESASFDDHVKVFFPPEGSVKPILPTVGPDGRIDAVGTARPIARDFTPRRFDRGSGELDIEFVLHHAGPATQWAAQAQVGQYLGVGGPRGSMIIPPAFDWHLLIGDDTALPAIARRLEELPSSACAIVIVEIADASARINFRSQADLQTSWCYRSESNSSSLSAVLRQLPSLPSGEGYAWVAAEATIVRQVRLQLISERAIDKTRIRAAAYWKRGAQAVHEVIED